VKRRRIDHALDHYPIMRCHSAALFDLFAYAARTERERALRLRGGDPAANSLERLNGLEKDEVNNSERRE
jgi:hypothetical protein